MTKKIFRALLCAALAALLLSGCAVVKIPVQDETKERFPVTEMEQFGTYKHYFSALGEEEKAAYNCILRQIEEFPERIEVPVLSSQQLEKVWLALMYDNPQLFMLGRECGINVIDDSGYFYCDYALSRADYEKKKALLEARVSSIEDDLSKLSSAFEKELYIHDMIIDSCGYVSSDDLINSTVCGVLLNGEASCEGYAKAAKLLLDAAGVENFLICGTARRETGESEGHMWNVVIIDGKPYNLDLTWDDPIGESVQKNKRYAYFNVTDEEIQKTHSFADAPAGCTERTENYFVKTGRQFDSYDSEMRSSLAGIISKNETDGKFDIRFSSQQAYDSAKKGLFENEDIYRVLELAALSSKASFSTTQIRYISDDTHLILEIITVAE